tara:strand:- start:138 stop:461 length:324 start_codon:yes stop_codon:yes gene_type:complete
MNATATASLLIAQGITPEISTEGLGDLLAASEQTIGLDVDAVREAMADLLGTFTAEELHGSWSVRDSRGGVWWPNDDASAEIEADRDPATEAVRICREESFMGAWFQ